MNSGPQKAGAPDWLQQIRDVRNLLASLPLEDQTSAGLINLEISGESSREEQRSKRFALSSSERLELKRKAQKVRQKYSPFKTQRDCGLYPIPNSTPNGGTAPPMLEVHKGGGYYRGLATCGNQYCPNCMGKSRGDRAKRIMAGLKGAKATEAKSYFVTFTSARSAFARRQVQKHSRTWLAVRKAMNYALGKVGASMQFVRSHDVTFRPYSRDVFHNHFHIVAVVIGEYEGFEALFISTWTKYAKKFGLKASLSAQDIQAVEDLTEEEVSRYSAKWWGMGKELTNFAMKSGKESSTGEVSYGWMELMGLCDAGDERAIDTYQSHLKATAGKRTIVFSNGWKELELLAPPEEEEEEEEEKELLFSIVIPLDWWFKIKNIKGDLLVTAHWLAVNKPRHLVFLENLWKHDYEYELEEGEELGHEALYISADAGPTDERLALFYSWLSQHYPRHLWANRL